MKFNIEVQVNYADGSWNTIVYNVDRPSRELAEAAALDYAMKPPVERAYVSSLENGWLPYQILVPPVLVPPACPNRAHRLDGPGPDVCYCIYVAGHPGRCKCNHGFALPLRWALTDRLRAEGLAD